MQYLAETQGYLNQDNYVSTFYAELFTGWMNPRVRSGRVTILPDFGGLGQVSTSDF